MKIAYISTYLPRECGIATFTNDIFSHIHRKIDYDKHEQNVFVITEDDATDEYPQEVKFQIRVNNSGDYRAAATFINDNGYDLCVLQHEYGIYGGDQGRYVLTLIHLLNIPLISILHTILEKPSAEEKSVLMAIAQRSAKLIVMNSEANRILNTVFHIPINKIVHIPHGVPTFTKKQQQAKELLGIADKKVLMTFGFIGRSKGIEVALKALPKLVDSFPEILYLVVGKTHPNILKNQGEEYRESLVQLTKNLNVEDHVRFVNQFVDDDTLSTYLSACDVYITPYVSENQITSGTLSFAIGAGAAVLSTPYLHAKDLLADERGILFPFNDSVRLYEELNGLFTNPQKLATYRKKSSEFGKHLSWSALVDTYVDLFEATSGTHIQGYDKSPLTSLEELHLFDLSHIKRLTNQVGIVQHATFATPNLKEGYCLDDNARALFLLLASLEHFEDEDSKNLISTYLSYMNYVQKENGQFRNFISFDHQFLDECGTDDSFGRAIWSLGYLFKRAPYYSFHQLGNELFFRAIPQFSKLTSIRAIAYTILGIVYYLEYQPNDERLLTELEQLTNFMVKEYEAHQSNDWQWFERILSYDNAILPLAILRAYPHLKMENLKEIGWKTANFLDEILFKNGYFSPIGNEGWYSEGQPLAKFGQQPIEVASAVLLNRELYKQSGNTTYLSKCIIAFEWFAGANDLKLPLYDEETKGCCDGLERHGVNRNQGAESTICYWLSYIALHDALSSFKSAQG